MNGPSELAQGVETQRASRDSDRAGSRNVCVYAMLCLCLVSFYLLTAARNASIGDAEERRRYPDTPQCRRCKEKPHEAIPSSAGGAGEKSHEAIPSSVGGA